MIEKYTDQDLSTHTGLLSGVPEEEYHALPFCSNSRLTLLKTKTALHVKHSLGDTDETAAQRLGSIAHMALFEPKRYQSLTIQDEHEIKVRNGKKWDALKEKYGEANIIKMSQKLEADEIREMIKKNCADLFDGGEPEVTALFDVPVEGADPLRCKLRIDYYNEEKGLVVDLKTARDASPAAFSKAVANYGYHRQSVMYASGLKYLGLPIERRLIVAVESFPPYAVATYELDDNTLREGMAELRQLLGQYAECVTKDEWPGYEPQELSIPYWAFNETMPSS